MSRTVGIYIHIPFCKSKCDYCDFFSCPAMGTSVWDKYLKALARHIRETSASVARLVTDSIYFGGGTPSLMGAKRLCPLLDVLDKHYQLSQDTEITLECNPDSVDEKMLEKLHRHGVNRLSFGAQSFDDEMLKLLGRPHDSEKTRTALETARGVGFKNIGIDLLYGLPGQSLAHWAETLRMALKQKPEHISCYGLTLEKGTALHEKRGEYAFPDDDAQADMYLLASEVLCAHGYLHYEISNYCLPGFECRHNMKYWTLQPYIGLGPSAHSEFGGLRWSYPASLEDYIDGVNQNDTLVDRMDKIPMQERAGEYLMLGLRTARGVSGNEYARLFNASFDTVEARLEVQRSRGLALCEGDRWRLTERGFLLSNRVIGDVLG